MTSNYQHYSNPPAPPPPPSSLLPPGPPPPGVQQQHHQQMKFPAPPAPPGASGQQQQKMKFPTPPAPLPPPHHQQQQQQHQQQQSMHHIDTGMNQLSMYQNQNQQQQQQQPPSFRGAVVSAPPPPPGVRPGTGAPPPPPPNMNQQRPGGGVMMMQPPPPCAPQLQQQHQQPPGMATMMMRPTPPPGMMMSGTTNTNPSAPPPLHHAPPVLSSFPNPTGAGGGQQHQHHQQPPPSPSMMMTMMSGTTPGIVGTGTGTGTGIGGPPPPMMMTNPSASPMTHMDSSSNHTAVTSATSNTNISNSNDGIDYNVTIPSRLIRWSTNKIPQTSHLANSFKIPMGAVLRPLAPITKKDEETHKKKLEEQENNNDNHVLNDPNYTGDDDIPVIQPGLAGIVRCKRCRTYMNAFVQFLEHGRRWRCNICFQMNDTPSAYYCHLNEYGYRYDRNEKYELCNGVVEYIAPPEYMVRPPQEPTYFFVIDVSYTSIKSGMLSLTVQTIKSCLDTLPGKNRTKIGFVTYNTSVHYYNLSSNRTQPQMLLVSDLKELFVPLPDDLLVNLYESRHVVDHLLDHLHDMFAKQYSSQQAQQSQVHQQQSCLGPALKAAFTVMKQIGGKMCVFQSILPNLGDGSLYPPRFDPKMMSSSQTLIGTPNEMKLLKSSPDATTGTTAAGTTTSTTANNATNNSNSSSWYKETAIEFSKQQISVDIFLFPYQYIDIASLSELSKNTSGNCYTYPFFHVQRDGLHYQKQLQKCLLQKTVFEAVMRIRCTKGLRITNVYGNFYIRGTDLLALPNCNTESVFAFDIAHDNEQQQGQGQGQASSSSALLNNCSHITIQAALLYTSSDGERRIRVITQAIPVTSILSDLVSSVDIETTITLLARQSLDIAYKSNLDNVRIRLQQICMDAIRATKMMSMNIDQNSILPDNYQLYPLYTLALIKHVAFRGGTDIHPDERIQAFHTLNRLWVNATIHYIYPRMFPIHTLLETNAGLSLLSSNQQQENNNNNNTTTAGMKQVILPNVLNLSIDRLSSDGVYLLDTGIQEMYVWVGRSANLNVISSLFNVHSIDDMDTNTMPINRTGDELSTRFGNIVEALSEDPYDTYYTIYPKIKIIKEGDVHNESRFFWFMIEDRAHFPGGTYSYDEFMYMIMHQQQQQPNQHQPHGTGMPHRGGGPGVGPPGIVGHHPNNAPLPPTSNVMAKPPPSVPSQQQQQTMMMRGGPPPPAGGGNTFSPPHATTTASSGGVGGPLPPRSAGMMPPSHLGGGGPPPPGPPSLNSSNMMMQQQHHSASPGYHSSTPTTTSSTNSMMAPPQVGPPHSGPPPPPQQQHGGARGMMMPPPPPTHQQQQHAVTSLQQQTHPTAPPPPPRAGGPPPPPPPRLGAGGMMMPPTPPSYHNPPPSR